MAIASPSAQDAVWIEKELRISGAASGPLKGLTCAIKDLYDIEGHITGFGNPTWRATHEPATSTAPAVAALLAAGATVVGKTTMDELAYSINGENIHYGTPANPAAPGRIPGGSSSGSAVAVASGQADIGLGSDTGGSVRIPASYCGILGIRPTHGRVSLEACRPLGPSFDTGGWFAKDAATLRAAGDVLLATGAGGRQTPVKFTRLLVGTDAFALADAACAEALHAAVASLGLRDRLASSDNVSITADGDSLQNWLKSFSTLQGAEAWAAFGAWVESCKPELGPGIKQRVENASKVTSEQVAEQNAARARIRQRMVDLMGDDGVLVVPSAASVALPTGMDGPGLDECRQRAITIMCVAGLAGLPQVSLPLARVDGLPIGLGLIGPHGSDEALLALTEELMAAHTAADVPGCGSAAQCDTG